MATVDELQYELVKQSSARLEAEHERTRLEEQLRKLLKENQALREENAAATGQVEEMQNEMADLSSSLVEQANVQVAEANRKVASAQRMVAERDTLLEIQASELQEIKRMMASQEAAAPPESAPRRRRRPSYTGKLDADAILDLDSYASPVRPMLRLDTREFREFCEIFPVEGAARSFHFSLEALEAPAWRRSRFVTKLIQEDIEPALRLDRAAHMNWLTCRAFLNAVLDQTLILEPVSAKERPWAHRPSHPCLLCGENRAELIYSRYFWARTTPEAEPLVLDLACLAKVRLACELIGHVRSITDSKPGHTPEQQEQAWRECTSLREQLFWARTGGLYPEAGDSADLGDAADTSNADGSLALDRLRKTPGSDLSRVSTPQMSQGAFAVASPANTISSAVLENAVPPRPAAAQSHLASSHKPQQPPLAAAAAAGGETSDSRDVSSKPKHAAYEHPEPKQAEQAKQAATATARSDPGAGLNTEEASTETDTFTQSGDERRGARVDSGSSNSNSNSNSSSNSGGRGGGTPAQFTTSYESTNSPGSSPASPKSPPIPQRSRSPPRFTNAMSERENESSGPGSASPTHNASSRKSPQSSPRKARTGATENGGSAAENVAATPESEAEFHFDDDEFHSPAGTPDPAPREKMPGGWPG